MHTLTVLAGMQCDSQLVRKQLGFAFLLRDPSTQGHLHAAKSPGIEPPTFRSPDNPLRLLGRGRPYHNLLVLIAFY